MKEKSHILILRKICYYLYPNRVLTKVKVFSAILIMIQPFMSALHTNIFLAFSNIRVTFTACSWLDTYCSFRCFALFLIRTPSSPMWNFRTNFSWNQTYRYELFYHEITFFISFSGSNPHPNLLRLYYTYIWSKIIWLLICRIQLEWAKEDEKRKWISKSISRHNFLLWGYLMAKQVKKQKLWLIFDRNIVKNILSIQLIR